MIRFISYEDDAETGARRVNDIIEWGPSHTPAATRRNLMRQFGRLVDQMLAGEYDISSISVERMDS